MFHRAITEHVLEDLQLFPVAGIVGPRQVGKTTLAKYLRDKIGYDTLYLDLELDTDRNTLSEAEIFLKFHQEKCIIIDEIQRMPELFPLLRALVDMNRQPGRFIILGSASPSLIKNSSETLAGRVSYTELTPFSVLELPAEISLQTHWIRGGFPQALFASKDEHVKRWLHAFVGTFIYRDLSALGYKVSPETIGRLLEMLSVLNGNLLNVSNLSRSLGLSQPTINHYLDLLEGGFIIHRLRPYHTNSTKRLVKSPKVYIRDSGILHSIANISSFQQLLASPIIGASWESYVVEQCKRVLHAGWKFYFYRTHKGAESDLVMISPDGEKICVEIKLSISPKVSRGFYEAIDDLKPSRSFVVTPEGSSTPKDKGVILCGIKEFFSEHMNVSQKL